MALIHGKRKPNRRFCFGFPGILAYKSGGFGGIVTDDESHIEDDSHIDRDYMRVIEARRLR